MLRWFVFTIAMGLLPFGFSALLQTLRGVPPGEWQNSPEPLLFAVMVCSVQLGSIFDALSQRPAFGEWRRAVLSIPFGIFLIGAVLSAALYGVYIDQERNAAMRHAVDAGTQPVRVQGIPPCDEWVDLQATLHEFSINLAGFVGCLGTLAEWLCTRRRR